MEAISKVIPSMTGEIVRYVGPDHFVVRYAGYDILAHKDWWVVSE